MPPERSPEDVEPGDHPGIPRPRETTTLVGHDAAQGAFAEGIATGRLHHAWLIGGPHGIGKATLAYGVARRLLAYPRGGGPAGLDVAADDPVRGKVAGLSHPNLVALRRHRAPGAKALPTKISVDMVRRALDLFSATAADSGWRVCILDSAEDLNANAANALLKVLEEPPPRALFLILAHQPGRLLPTIRSRCRTLMLKPLRDDAVAQVVRGLSPPFPQPEEASLARAVAQSEGSVARALLMLDPVTAGLVAEVETLLTRAATPDWGRVLKLAETADVFLTNLRPRALERLGLDTETVAQRYPRLIYARGHGYGVRGPDANQDVRRFHPLDRDRLDREPLMRRVEYGGAEAACHAGAREPDAASRPAIEAVMSRDVISHSLPSFATTA